MTASESTHHQFQQPPTDMPDDITAPKTKLVYYCIKTHNGVTAKELSERLDMPMLTIYGLLSTLEDTGSVTKTNNEYC